MLIFSVLIVYSSLVQADRVIMTTTGPVQGMTVKSEGFFLEAYLGIPYAEPPIGRLRFAKPVPKTRWKGVYDATKFPPPCIQNVTYPTYYKPDISNMTEDCLYLNIWTSHSQFDSKLKSVLFFIHGGAFNSGSSNMKVYDGTRLAARSNVVVVTINYRVGAMGFFFALIDDAGGNMGLRDQILALDWIRSNAASFGGDPENIVVIGESSGAISAAILAMSPASKHMIKRAIIQSGSPMTPIILDENVRLYELSQRLATLVGCADKKVSLARHSRKIVKCLKSVPPINISRAEGILQTVNEIIFVPRMEDDIFPKNSVEMIRNGDLKDTEMLIGITKNEGAFFLLLGLSDYFGVYGSDPATISKHLTSQLIKTIAKMMGVADSREISNFYVNSVENGTSEKYIQALSDSFGDLLITCSTIFMAEFHSLKNNVYFYKFTHRAASSVLADWMSVTHFDDVQYVFGNPMFGNFTEEEQILSNRMMDRWTAFAKTGNPNLQEEVNWPLFSYKNPLYLDMNVKERVLSRPEDYRCESWREKFQAVIDDDVIKRLQSSAAIMTAKIIYLMVPMLLLMLNSIIM